MCRWLAYSGSPIALAELLYKPQHSLIDQSRHARMGVETTNGDGCGVGWYPDLDGGAGPAEPAIFHATGPAWSDRNLLELSRCVRSPLFLAHIRASTGTAVQQSNCHPFRYGRWLWMHNGAIHGFPELKRDLALSVDPSLYPFIEGSTDSELMFYVALTFGLQDDTPRAVERMIGTIEAVGQRHGVLDPLQMTVAVSDGRRLWAFRYSTERHSRSLFFSTDVRTLRILHPEIEALSEVADGTRIVVSEPLGDLEGAWHEVPESSYGVVEDGHGELHQFSPLAP
ncbi:class II glutamine amidotransferase [Kitasatospora sp. DSM 101779]|uniref:class II glutamine amidotransferase n=1 Tax=Kitasatospora sp. DSM 101779 TaxID=2853165 RepID=UPI0021D991E1|nr:class II glutamine amidotransferase [Kitasatospora sp. DSM 101779]MCU7820680.1 class II glutamine amidotransferase [Kitasatospora sp. DSM 101779]